MKKYKYLIIIPSLISILFGFPISSFASSPEKSKILKSFISEDASFKAVALSPSDCVSVKNQKDSFRLDDKKITWSASIRGGLGTYNTSDYAVYWYAPDGSLFGKKNPKAKQEIIAIIDKLVKKGAKAIILGCTELPLIVHQSDVKVLLFDTMKIHAEKAVAYSLK